MDIKLIVLGLVGIGIKLLLIPAYFSTDFDVHHNWLRITFTKPLSEWYYDVSYWLDQDYNKWTLDYPPFFAYFQYALAWIANFIDPDIMKLIVTNKVLYFQRISVILTQIPFLYILYVIFNHKVSTSLIVSYLFIPLIILDNIHFQYNIMLQTVFLAAVYFLVRKQNYLIAALIYSVLLNFKHIYLYCSIAFFVLILKNYVLKSSVNPQGHNQNRQKLARLVKVGAITLLPFFISFAPFIAVGGIDGIKQIFSRLFPFGRGLIHDYWAPNFWALYFFADKILFFVLKVAFKYQPVIELKTPDNGHKALNYLKVLPEPSANMTLVIILVCLIPLILHSIKARKLNGLNVILINGLVFFMFGYHVHQKAISPYLHLCYVFLASNDWKASNKQRESQYTSISQSEQDSFLIKRYQETDKKHETDLVQVFCIIFFNIFNLFPLLIDIKEKPLKIVIAILYFLMLKIKISELLKKGNKHQARFYQYLSNLCLILVLICEIFIPCFNWLNGNKYEFLPLMINSVSCGLANFVWVSTIYYKELNQVRPYFILRH